MSSSIGRIDIENRDAIAPISRESESWRVAQLPMMPTFRSREARRTGQYRKLPVKQRARANSIRNAANTANYSKLQEIIGRANADII
jgi:hypothetical protein